MNDAARSAARLAPELIADMRATLRAEFGARAAYGFLARRIDDPELADVLMRYREDEDELVRDFTSVMRDLGISRIPSSGRRHAAAAWLLALVSGRRRRSFALRMCLESEEKLGRSYWSYAEYLMRSQAVDLARRCEDLARVKAQHARVLSAWVPR